MPTTTLKELLDAGVHFGHQTKRWNPKMRRYIYGERNGIYVIDLKKTVLRLQQACDFIRDTVTHGQSVLFIGTKRQGREVVEAEARRCQMHFVNERWLGGMLTNFQTIKKNIDRYKKIEAYRTNGTYERLPKKEVLLLEKDRAKLEKYLAGILEMNRLPGAVFVVDTKKERIAVHEATRLGIPVVAILDTNCDPENVTYPIPGNDDAIRSIKLISAAIADAALEGIQARPQYQQETVVEKPVSPAHLELDELARERDPDLATSEMESVEESVGDRTEGT